MKIVVAPDSFKECLSAREVAEVMALAVRALVPEARLIKLPLADGGEGTLEVVAPLLNAEIETVQVPGPLGRPVLSRYGRAGETAILEVAQACGLQLVQPHERNPFTASTKGVGELLKAAFQKGCRHLLIGLGGTATCDGGAGMLAVPGVKEALRSCRIELLSDVTAPLTGPSGAARVFGPQKGATPEQVEELEQRISKLALQWQLETGRDVAQVPGAGAAGGLGGAFLAFSNARLFSGARRIMDLCHFDEAIKGATLIITGEGKSDAQTLMGKVPRAVLQRAGSVPVALLSGRVEDKPLLEQAGFRYVLEISPRNRPLQEVMKPEAARRYISSSLSRISFSRSCTVEEPR